MRFISLIIKMMMRAMALIPILAIAYIVVYFLVTGVNTVDVRVWKIAGLVLAAAAVFIGAAYAGWAIFVPFKRAVRSARKGIRLSYFEDTAKFAYERTFDKANEYMKLWRNSSGKINILSILLLPVWLFIGISIHTIGILILSVLVLLFAPVIAWIFSHYAKDPGIAGT